MTNIAIFASGSGTNAEKIFQHFQNHKSIRVSCLLSNKQDAFALERAKKWNIPTYTFNQTDLCQDGRIAEILEKEQIDWIVLAGFLWLLPAWLIEKYPKKIINIHPALLPKYGGKGMYGMKVHQTVWNNKEPFTGITIHYANAVYDEGEVIFQEKVAITPEDTPETIAKKVHQLEYQYFPAVIEDTIKRAKK
ncbi:MAG: phosphoribosylglycinamide formyltransferase [Raineya sp.]